MIKVNQLLQLYNIYIYKTNRCRYMGNIGICVMITMNDGVSRRGLSNPFLEMGPGPMELGKLASF